MSGFFGLLGELLRRLVRNWPHKAVAVLVAFGFWWVVTTTTTTITQRSFTIPLEVDGVEAQELAVGLPDVVDVSVSGPGPRVDRLRPDQIRATLDLNEASGEFDRQVVVQTPQEVKLLSVTPSNVIGFLETVAQRVMPVEVGLLDEPPPGTLVRTAPTPAQVVLSGRQQQLSAVARAVALAGPDGGEASVVTLDADGLPVPGVVVTPAKVEVVVSSREVLYVTDVLVELQPLQSPAIASVSLTRPTATIAGPPDSLAPLLTVPGSVEPLTGTVAPGRYTLPVRLDLPEGVVVLAAPAAVVQYVDEPLQP